MSAIWSAAHWLSPLIHYLWPAVANGGRQSVWTADDSTVTNVVFVVSTTWFHTGWSPKGLSLHQLHMVLGICAGLWFWTSRTYRSKIIDQPLIYAHGVFKMLVIALHLADGAWHFLCILDIVLFLVDVSCLRLYEILWCLNIRMQCHKDRFWFLSMAVVVEQLFFGFCFSYGSMLHKRCSCWSVVLQASKSQASTQM